MVALTVVTGHVVQYYNTPHSLASMGGSWLSAVGFQASGYIRNELTPEWPSPSTSVHKPQAATDPVSSRTGNTFRVP